METLTTAAAAAEVHVSSSSLKNAYGDCINDNIKHKTVVSFLAVAMGVVMLCENLLLITVIARTRSLHTNTNILVASLAVTDLLVSLEACVMGMAGQPNGGLRAWLGLRMAHIRVFDSLLTGLNFSLIAVSMCHFAVLAVDRYLYVLWPLHYTLRVTRGRVIAVACVLWTVGVTYMLLPVLLFTAPRYHVTCIVFDPPAEYGPTPLLAVYTLCLCVVLSSIVGVAKMALKHRRGRQRRKLACVSRPPPQDAKVKLDAERSSCASRSSNKNNGCDETVGNRNNKTGSVSIFSVSKPSSPAAGNNIVTSTRTPKVVNGDGNRNGMCATTDVGECAVSQQQECLHETSASGHRSYKESSTPGEPVPAWENLCLINPSPRHGEPNVVFARNHSAVFTKSNPKNSALFSNLEKNNTEDNNKCAEKARLFSKENVKIIKFVTVMFGCFLVCTFPPLVMFLLDGMMGIVDFPGVFTGSMFTVLASNSGMNFLIITYMRKDFRAALIQFLQNLRRRCCYRNSSR